MAEGLVLQLTPQERTLIIHALTNRAVLLVQDIEQIKNAAEKADMVQELRDELHDIRRLQDKLHAPQMPEIAEKSSEVDTAAFIAELKQRGFM